MYTTMDTSEKNMSVLCDIFGITKSDEDRKKRMDMRKWYETEIKQHLLYVEKPKLMWLHSLPCCLGPVESNMCVLSREQTGGAKGEKNISLKQTEQGMSLKLLT